MSDNICLFGGTFDPIHIGHLKMISTILENIDIQSLYVIPTGDSYLKRGVTDALIRYDMCRIALDVYFKDNSKVILSDVEVKREGPSYTFETIKYFKDLYPNKTIYFLIGEDSLLYIDKWKNYQDILNDSTLLVLRRRINGSFNVGTEAEANRLEREYKAKIKLIDFDFDISSTSLREMLEKGDNRAEKYIIPTVYAFIKEKNLY